MKKADVQRKFWSEVYTNKDFLRVETCSGYRSSRGDYKGAEYILAPDVSNEELGIAVLDALARSRFVLPADDPDLYDYKKSDARWESWVDALKERYGYTSKRKALKDVIRCGVTKDGDQISIDPTHHEKLEGWEGLAPELTVQISVKSSPAEVGAAVRLALSRCT